VGKPLPGVKVKIHAADMNGAGELWVSGPNVMMGYVDEVQTRETMEDSWYKTGDIARLVDGKIIITGRSKRLIVTESGKNVYPEDLEVLLERDPDLKEAGVLEVDMRPAAVLAVEPPDKEAKAKEIVKKFNARVSSHNQIVRYAVVEELPRTPLGKVALKDLPKIFKQFEIRKN
jgi:long-chain acyl-CoA synthetase